LICITAAVRTDISGDRVSASDVNQLWVYLYSLWWGLFKRRQLPPLL